MLDGFCDMGCATIGQIITKNRGLLCEYGKPINGSQNNVVDSPAANSLRRIFGLVFVQLRGVSCSLHGAKPKEYINLTVIYRQPRVHVSPISMIVAVEGESSPPPQHSLMFGHLASSQTVDNFKPLNCFFSFS